MKVEQSDINEFLIEIQADDEARLFIDRQHHLFAPCRIGRMAEKRNCCLPNVRQIPDSDSRDGTEPADSGHDHGLVFLANCQDSIHSKPIFRLGQRAIYSAGSTRYRSRTTPVKSLVLEGPGDKWLHAPRNASASWSHCREGQNRDKVTFSGFSVDRRKRLWHAVVHQNMQLSVIGFREESSPSCPRFLKPSGHKQPQPQ